MSAFLPRFKRTLDDGNEVRLVVDGHLAWFVERPEDRAAHAHPMGAFITEEAARRWADHHVPGGQWEPWSE